MLNILFWKKELVNRQPDINEEKDDCVKRKFSFFKAFILLTCMFALGGAVFIMSLFLLSTIML